MASPQVGALGQLPRHDASQADFIQDDQMIETLASNGADDAFRVRVDVSQSFAPLASGEAQTFRVTHPFHPLRGQTFQLVDCRQT